MLALAAALILVGAQAPVQDQATAPMPQSAPAASASPPSSFKVGAPVKWKLVAPPVRSNLNLTPLTAFFPERAERMGKDGHVKLACQLASATKLKSCAPISEDTPGFAFAQAAAKMASYLAVDESESLDSGGWIMLSVDFLTNGARPGEEGKLKVDVDLRRLTPAG